MQTPNPGEKYSMGNNPPHYECFAVCPPGLENLTAGELSLLGLLPANFPAEAHLGEGGIAFSATLGELYLANLYLRTAGRILIRFGSFHAAKFVELRRKAGNLAWEEFLQPGQAVHLRVTCHNSRLYHSGAVAERIVEAIGDRLGKPPALDPGGSDETITSQRVVIRLEHDNVSLSLDSSGEPLHKRGYRLASAKAPLRETLASAMLLASRWDCTSPLLDPFCGSGTIPIEAAFLTGNIAPGKNRTFAFMHWKNFDPYLWSQIHEKAVRAEKKHLSVKIAASDRDAGAIKIAQENAKRAGVADWIEFKRQAFSSALPPGNTGWIVTNPPYGIRVQSRHDLRNLYSGWGNALHQHFQGWRVAFLCTEDRLATLTGLHFEPGISMNNGGIAVKLFIGQVKA